MTEVDPVAGVRSEMSGVWIGIMAVEWMLYCYCAPETIVQGGLSRFGRTWQESHSYVVPRCYTIADSIDEQVRSFEVRVMEVVQ